ncbi:MAG: hypothetical protein WBS14_04935, partial [Rhodomicrobium sp.]
AEGSNICKSYGQVANRGSVKSRLLERCLYSYLLAVLRNETNFHPILSNPCRIRRTRLRRQVHMSACGSRGAKSPVKKEPPTGKLEDVLAKPQDFA